MNKEIVLLTGGTGMIGSHLIPLLIQNGYHVAVLSRKKHADTETVSYRKWNVKNYMIDEEIVGKADYIIHLAGANIAQKRWTPERKQEILDSRIIPVELIYQALKDNSNRLKTFISASAIGYYGTVTTSHKFTENDSSAFDFLGDVCQQWEEVTQNIAQLGVRTVNLRTGVVLAETDSALQKIAAPFYKSWGAVLGTGKQYMPWIHIDDLCRLYVEALSNTTYHGAYNAVVGDDLTNKELSSQMAEIVGKKIRLPHVPPFVLRLVLGEMATMLLEGSSVSSEKVRATGFRFEYETIGKALDNLLRKTSRN